jgi:hypothetical protein
MGNTLRLREALAGRGLQRESRRKAASDLGEELAVEGLSYLCIEGCESWRKVAVDMGEETGGTMSGSGTRRKVTDGVPCAEAPCLCSL